MVIRPNSIILRTTAFTILSIALSAERGFAEGVTRIEQDSPTITYSGNWYTNTSAAHSAGVAALTNAKGARAAITFTGTGINWVGVKDGWSGLATVYLDGTLRVVDTFSEIAAYSQVLYRVAGLPAGPHTLTIEVTHERGPNTQGSWVWIDAFDIENGSPVQGGVTATTGRIEENNPALVYTGRWFTNSSAALSGGGAVLATDVGSSVTIRFNGTGISWISYRDEWSGLARVYVDGAAQTTVDDYLSPAQTGPVYSINGLPFGAHTLTIEVTGTRNASSKASWVWLDAFDIAP